jgi:hypothetical protein
MFAVKPRFTENQKEMENGVCFVSRVLAWHKRVHVMSGQVTDVLISFTAGQPQGKEGCLAIGKVAGGAFLWFVRGEGSGIDGVRVSYGDVSPRVALLLRVDVVVCVVLCRAGLRVRLCVVCM